MTRTALRKLEKASGEEGGTGSPTKATPKSSAKKRKTAAAADGEGNGVGETPTKKRRGRKPKAANADADDAGWLLIVTSPLYVLLTLVQRRLRSKLRREMSWSEA